MEATLSEFCSLKQGVAHIKTLGMDISPRRLQEIANEFDVPFQKGAHCEIFYPSEKLINAFRKSFMTRSEALIHRRVVAKRKITR